MQITCTKCNRALDYSGERPSFCAYCGQALGPESTPVPRTADEAVTLVKTGSGGDAEAVPEEVGGYRLLRALGSGGMGTVYDAEEIATGRRVALKLIAPEFARSPDAVERFRQEGRIASMVAHPRCVFVLAVDEDAGRPYIVMERMPGETLKDLVDREGPLPAERAIALILDVVEGLQEAHRLDVIHRDVKPSNCFLDGEGRVKVGDFGLAKSLVKASHLTRTGAFVGTPHFASPEQVRGEAIDARTDVYSTAATLYYLLTGTPPFFGGDPGSALARILTDPPPRLRRARPDLSAALERVLLRGLERDREQRLPDLESFRQGLLALEPAPLAGADQLPRLAAYGIDYVLLRLAGVGAMFLGGALLPVQRPGGAAWLQWLVQGTFAILFLLYFTLLEHFLGFSLGKRLLRLRVASRAGAEAPPAAPAFFRTGVFFLLVNGGFLAAAAASSQLAGEGFGPLSLEQAVAWGWLGVGTVIVLSTMRSQNGYRGLHEWLSGTRVLRLAEPARVRASEASGGWLLSFLLTRRLDRAAAQARGLPEHIAGFAIRGALKWTPGDKVLLGEDASMGRRAFLWLRPQAAPELTRIRRDIGRRTRLRWLASGKQGDLQWDALLAPAGCPLPDYLQTEGALAWSSARPVLRELAQELTDACAEATLPESLLAGQVWLHADGRVQLADLALRADSQTMDAQGSDKERALNFLRQVTALVLEGQPRDTDDLRPIRAIAPEEGRRFLDRLFSANKGFETVQDVTTSLS